jgi:hypothetical protein
LTKPPKYVTIAEARLDPKGTSLIVKVVSIGDLKKGDDWKRQSVVVKDNSDSQEIMTWNKEIGLLEIGKCYKLDKPYWKEYEGDLQLSLGKYCTVMECQESDLLPVTQTTQHSATPSSITEPTTIPESPKGVDFDKLNREADAQKLNKELLATAREIIGASRLPKVNIRMSMIWATEMVVRDYLFETEKKIPNDQRVGMWVKLVLDEDK